MAPNSTMARLPHDIILDVLCRLGVKDLVRFRCISKPFCCSIDDPYFIKFHISHSLKTKDNRSLIFRTIKTNNKPSFDSRGCYLLSSKFDSLKTAQKLNHPFDVSLEGIYTEIVGSCNGLLALFNGEQISLWNPSTRNYRMLPGTPMRFPPWAFHCKSLVYGLGYDSISDDYKFVRIIQLETIDSEVKVYSLRTNSWKKIKDFPFYLRNERYPAVFANNALHWVVSKKPESKIRSFIVALDLATDEYHVVELPDGLDKCFHMKVKAMGGCLCLIAHYWGEVHVVDIWMRKEYGVKESWCKLISLKPFESVPAFKCVLPLAFSKNGDKVLLHINENNLFWYDIRSKRIDKVRIGGVPNNFEIEMLVESLVSLNGRANVIINNQKQHGNKKQKEPKKNNKRDAFLSKGFHLVL